MSATVLRISELHKSYRAGVAGCAARARVLRGVELAVHAGEVVAVVGAVGSGKTTLLRCACGLLRPDAGSIEWGVHRRPTWGALAPGVRLLAARHGRRVSERAVGGHEDARVSLLVVDDATSLALVRVSAMRGVAALIAARTVDDAWWCADRVLLLQDGVCRELPRVDRVRRPP